MVDFDITVDLLKYYNFELEYVAEPGEFRAHAAASAGDIRSTAKFTLK